MFSCTCAHPYCSTMWLSFNFVCHLLGVNRSPVGASEFSLSLTRSRHVTVAEGNYRLVVCEIAFYCGELELSVSVFRPGGISVHYSLNFEINSLKTNMPESSKSTIREMVTKALREEATLPIALETLNLEPGSIGTSLNKWFKIELHVKYHE